MVGTCPGNNSPCAVENMSDINVQIPDQFQDALDEQWTREVVRYVLDEEDVPSQYDLTVVFTDTDEVQRLNRDYRGVDSPTDVIAFYMLQNRAPDPSFPLPPDDTAYLGDVVVCYPVAVEQAGEEGHPVSHELALLIIHGVLHLLGYDHEQPDEEARMRSKESHILHRWSAQGGYLQ